MIFYNNLISFCTDVPLIINQDREIQGNSINITWKPGSCPVAGYTVSYRDLTSGGRKWKEDDVSTEVDHHKLYLNCLKEYEIKVNGWVTNVTFSSKPWKVKTGSGTKLTSKQKLTSSLTTYLTNQHLHFIFIIAQHHIDI